VDTVHQGDWNGEKGVYHLNTIDAVTQWEIVGCVERISERYLVPVLKDLLTQYPFVIHGFHSDNVLTPKSTLLGEETLPGTSCVTKPYIIHYCQRSRCGLPLAM